MVAVAGKRWTHTIVAAMHLREHKMGALTFIID